MKNLCYSNLVKSVLFKFPVGFLGSSNPINMLNRKLSTVLTPFCSQLIQTQLIGQTNLQLWCICVLHNKQLPSRFSFQRDMHIKNVWGVNKALHFVQVNIQESGKRTGNLPLFSGSSILSCEIQCFNYIFPRKNIWARLKYQNTRYICQYTLVSPVLPLFCPVLLSKTLEIVSKLSV